MTLQADLLNIGRLPDRKRHARITASSTGIGSRRRRYPDKRRLAMQVSREQIAACLDAYAPMEWRRETGETVRAMNAKG